MMDSPHPEKAALRASLRKSLAGMASGERELQSQRLREQIESWPEWQNAENLLLFAPMALEPDLFSLLGRALQKGKRVCLPRHDPLTGEYSPAQIVNVEEDLHPGRYNIHEPGPDCPIVAIKRLDLILVPGLGFDLQGRRLGRGKGFYDKLLGLASGIKCGVSFEQQILPTVPVEAHDVTMDWILTPARRAQAAPPRLN